MQLNLFSIKQNNNTLNIFSGKEKMYSSGWFMEFGKFGCEVFNTDEKVVYSITKKFQFWKWKMIYSIKNNKGNISELISKNNRKTIFSIDVDEITYEIKIHYKKKKSIYKNGIKIAELDESFLDENFKNSIKLQLLDKKDLDVSFLLFSCLNIGVTDLKSKTILTSQKQLEINNEPWN